MKVGRSLEQISAQLLDEQDSKRDYLVDTRSLAMVTGDEQPPALRMHTASERSSEVYSPTKHIHGQIAHQTGIGQVYYKRMLADAPNLLALNVNHWMQSEPKTRMLRTLNGDARALLSNSYRCLDNADLATMALPLLQERNAEVRSAEITERRFYLKAIIGGMTKATSVGDVVAMGVTISNSEIGAGALQIYPFVETLACKNGMTITRRDGEHDWSLTRRHIGAKQHGDSTGLAVQYISDEARRAEDLAFWLTARDAIKAVLSDDVFGGIVERIDAATNRPIERPIQQVVEVTRERLGLRESEGESVLEHLARGGQHNAWGLSSAITRTAEDVTNYDRASELEKIGWRVIEMGQRDWQTLALAA